MTPEERTLLTQFLNDLNGARTGPKDREAEDMILQALSRNPDAAYLLVQHAILSDQALHAAQARIRDLEAGQGQTQGSFLGAAQPQYQQRQYAQGTAVPPSQPFSQPGLSPFSGGGGLGNFLRSAGTMAAGVAAGDMLFEGLSGLFGGHRGYGGFGGGWGQPVENVTINEYIDDDRGGYDDGGGWDSGSDS